jgi:hypothetical protein
VSRKTDLEEHIRESYDLVREYEAIIQTSSDPKEKARSQRAIAEQWELIEGSLTEYRRLVNVAFPDDIAEIAAHFGAESNEAKTKSSTTPSAPQWRNHQMLTDPQSYDLAVIRDLLLAAFTADDLRRLVLYTSRSPLKPLIHQFSSGDGLAAMVEKTTTYCDKQGCLPDLLAEIRKANPRQYARFESRLSTVGEATQTTSASSARPETASGGTTYVTHIRHAQGLAIGDGATVHISPKSDEDDEVDESD